MAKKRKRDLNRFQEIENKGLLSFEPIRRKVLLWGMMAGLAGGFLMIQQQLVWQVMGVLVIVFVGNYHISRAARYIPRWHAAVLSFIGMSVALVGVVVIGTIILTYFHPAGG